MTATTARVLRVLFWTYVAATFLHIAYVVHHEPFAFDAWNVAVDTGAKPPSIGRFFAFWHQQYTSSNPRIGQPLAYLAYKLVGFAELGTPLAYLGIVLGGFVFGARRWPSLKSGRDQATLAIGIGFLWFAAPSFPSFLFCRAYATNYVWAVGFQLWFLAVLRLHDPASADPSSVLRLVGYALLGVIAGMCNEHTGPTLLVFAVGYGVWVWRKHGRPSRLIAAGTVGAIVGYALIFFAPGQGQRYEGLADRYSLTEQILVRGLTGNLDILENYLNACAPILVMFALVIGIGLLVDRRTDTELVEVRERQRGSVALVGLCLVGGVLIAATIFASPKLGPRFYMHASILLMAGVMGVISAFLSSPRSFAPFIVLAVAASTYAAFRTVPMFTRLSSDSDERLAQLAKVPVGGVYTAEAWEQVPDTWWFLGDDFRDQKKRELVAKYFGLTRVLFRGGDQWSTLGVTDVKLTMRYDFDPPICLDEIESLDLKPYVGHDVAALHHAFLDAIVEIQATRAARLRAVDLVATFLGTQPPMPRNRTYVARWKEGVFEGYTTNIKRLGRSHDRELVLSPELKRSAWSLYAVAVGDAPRLLGVSTDAGPFVYQPWRTAQYWILACKPDHCFVTFTVRHKA